MAQCQLCGAGYRKAKIVHVVQAGKLVRKRVCLACERKCIVVFVPDAGEALCVLCAKERAEFCGRCTQKRVRAAQREQGAVLKAAATKLRGMAKAYAMPLLSDEPNPGHPLAPGLEQAADIIEAGRF